MRKISRSWAFFILVILIVVAVIMIWFNIFNVIIVYGLLTGLVTGFIIKVLDWVTKEK